MFKHLLAAAVLSAGRAFAEMEFVTDAALCALDPVDRLESGATLTATGTSEIEYYCFWDDLNHIHWQTDQTQIRPGFCNEPGALFPDVFVFQSFRSEPGTLYMYSQSNNQMGENAGQPTLFYACQK